MARDWYLQLGKAMIMPRKNFVEGKGTVITEKEINQTKLLKAIQLAPEMVDATLDGLYGIKDKIKDTTKSEDSWSANRLVRNMDGDGFQDEAKRTEVYHALAKYFSLVPSDPEYLRWVSGLLKVYKKVKTGFESAYEIVVFDPDSLYNGKGTQGYVMGRGGKVTGPVSPIRQTFGFTDQSDHLEWNGYAARSKIHIALPLINSMDASQGAEEVARIIVHEATHKFASTTDVLYKHQSFGKMKENGKLSEANYQTLQPSLKIPEIPGKTIFPMAGVAKDDLIPPIQWLENADSYAWAARRLWKKFKRGAG